MLDTGPILQVGDPRLREVARPIDNLNAAPVQADMRRLQAALSHFRQRFGFGRGIAATQLGIPLRMIALELGNAPQLLINPVITWRSEGRFTLWDDCMSFPELLVRVERFQSISVQAVVVQGAWGDEGMGELQHWERLDQATSELLQHELDHLDGILALDRGVGPDAVISRQSFVQNPTQYLSQVDYVIPGMAGEQLSPLVPGRESPRPDVPSPV